MSKEQILQDITAFGYTINIELKDVTKYVTFNGRYTQEDYTLPKSYSEEYTDHEVKLDCVYDLMRWAGLHYETKLTYKG